MADVDRAALVLAPVPGLQTTRQGRGHRVRYVLSEPASGRHVALRPDAYRLLGELDGKRALRDIYTADDGRLPPRDRAAAVVHQLSIAGLVEAVGAALPPAPARPAGPPEAKLVSWRRELLDLGPWLPQLDRALGWMFTRPAAILWGLLVVAALWLGVDRWEPSGDLAGWLAQLDAGEAASLYVVFLLLKGLHELGHAIAYRRLAAAEGVPVTSVRAGIALMFLLPFPFTNVTGAWRLASRWRRAMVGAGGMYVESWAALAAILVWAMADDPVLRSAAGQVALVAGVTTVLFNLNPLGRMDGYYIVADLLDRPNLARQASQAALALLARIAGGLADNRAAPLEPSLLAYWAGSLLFRVGIYVTLFWAALEAGAAAAVAVLLVAGSLLIVRPMAASLRWLTSVTADPPRLRRRLIAVAGGLAALLLVPLPSTMRADGVVEKQGLQLVFAPRTAPLEAGGPPAFSARQARLEYAEIDARRREALARWRYALEDGQGSARRFGDEVRSLEAQAARLRRDIEQLEQGLRGDGVTPLDLADWRGAWVAASGRPLAVRVPSERYVVRAVARERDRAELSVGRRGEAQPLGRPDERFEVRVGVIEGAAVATLPSAALGRRFGGRIPVDPADPTGRRAVEPVVALTLTPVGTAPALRHGQRIELRLDGARQPLIMQWMDGLAGALGAPTAR